jgi:hypothetical protein
MLDNLLVYSASECNQSTRGSRLQHVYQVSDIELW